MGEFSYNRLQKCCDAFQLAHLGNRRLALFNCGWGDQGRHTKRLP
jgi:hypothetical protein